jgi:predicted ferric reductase
MLWYLTRATGIVALVLFSLATVLGIVTAARSESPTWPRFAVAELHKRVALACVGLLGLHVLTTVTDSFVHIGWQSIVIPFSSAYRRFWLGLGAVSVDLFIAVLVSSLFRHRISARVWRGIHWLAYASWPVAVVHALGTGTDRHLSWMLGLVGACVAAVVGAATWRAGIGVAMRRRPPDVPRSAEFPDAALVTTGRQRDRH